MSPTIVRIVIALAAWILFRMLASTYDAAVSTSGYFGLGMGATPTAIAVVTATNASSFDRPSLGIGKADAHAIGARRVETVTADEATAERSARNDTFVPAARWSAPKASEVAPRPVTGSGMFHS